MNTRPRLQQHQWEAIYTVDFTLDGLRRRCQHLAAEAVQRGWAVLVAHDTRFLSGQFARYAYLTLEAQGARVKFCPQPAPMPAVELALEQKRADCALVVSAANRPHWYNGLIVLAPPVASHLLDQAGPQPDRPEEPAPFPPPALDESEQTQQDLRGPYLELLRALVDVELIRKSSLTMFADTMNGSTSGLIPALIGEGAQARVIEINREVDPLFGRQSPQPVEAGLARLRKLVKESDSHAGVALSADGRALGVSDNTGELLAPVELTLLLAGYLAKQYRQKGVVVLAQAAGETPLVRSWEQATGIKVELASDPATRSSELLTHDRNSVLAAATSTAELTLGRYSTTPDATLAALLLLELIARSNGKLRPLIEALRSG